MRIILAPQEFKGSLTAIEAARAMALGIRDALPRAEIVEAPMSDGGPGLVDAMLAAKGGRRIDVQCADPLLRPITASFALLSDDTAAIEMAAASGLVLLREHERDPLVATTYGTGELIRAALDHAPREIILGVGGSATVDGGAGAVRALGARLVDAHGDEIAHGGAALAKLARVELSGLDPRVRSTRIRIACDVTNPLVGPEGAAALFGPQKGASPAGVRILDYALRQFADVLEQEFGVDVAMLAGSGAAGGLPAALIAMLGASIEPGFDLVAEVTGLDAKIAAADIIITGEGRLDSQTAYGKTASGVARLAREQGKSVGVIAGHVDASYVPSGEFDAVEELRSSGMTLDQSMGAAADLVRRAAKRMVTRLAPTRD